MIYHTSTDIGKLYEYIYSLGLIDKSSKILTNYKAFSFPLITWFEFDGGTIPIKKIYGFINILTLQGF